MTGAGGLPPLRHMRGWGPGYAADDVDALLERIRLDLVSSSDVENAQLGSTWRGPRYDERTVDEALDLAVTQLRARGR